MKLHVRHIPAIIVVLLCCACTKEELPVRPDSYLQLVSRYQEDIAFAGAEKNGSTTVVSFDHGGSIKVDSRDFQVSNCTFKDPQIPETNKSGHWTVGGRDTGIPYNSEASLEDSYPVYAYYNSWMFCLYASNGCILKLFSSEADPLKSFSLLSQFNPGLAADIHFSIDGTDVTGTVDGACAKNELVPTFTFEAESVTVNGAVQTSSSSVQDFTEPVCYEVHKHNGETVRYTVSIDCRTILPIVRITTANKSPIVSKTNYISGNISFEDPSLIYSSTALVESVMQIRGRGNTSWSSFPEKRPYRVKLESSKKVFGIQKDKDWDLLANQSDKSLLRNHVAMQLSRICEMPWTPELRSVNLYLNGVYKGVYDLIEHKEVGDHKVEIQPVGENDNSGDALTGGYYLEIDTSQDNPVHFYTDVGIPIMFSDPENPTKEQISYIKKYLKDFETALYSANFTDPQKGYAAYIDVESFINYYIVAELSKNIDGNLAKSCFLSKDRGGKLTFCHTWDYDLAFGNCDYMDSSYHGATNGPEGWFTCKYIIGDYYSRGSSPGWFGRLMEDPAYVRKLQARWNELYSELQTIPAYIDTCVEGLHGAQDDNFATHSILGAYVWPNLKVFKTYDEEISYLKSFYSQRLAWMDSAIRKL